MHDSDVRSAVLGWLVAKFAGDPRTRIVEEMGIWSGTVRIDVAVINGELHGFELKSARDTLARLEHQASLYSQVFDRVTLVAAQSHLDKAFKQIPNWWGVACVTMPANKEPSLRFVRRARRNPQPEPIQLARLLWRAEAIDVLGKHGLSRGFKSAPAEKLALRLAECLTLRQLAQEVRDTLKSRVGWLGQTCGHERDVPVGCDGSPHGATAGAWDSRGDLSDPAIRPTLR
jgi:hypothetical protein